MPRSPVAPPPPPTRSATSPRRSRGRDLFADNAPLAEALDREGGHDGAERLHAAGRFWGGAPMTWGALANEHPPILHTHDRYGHRRDEVEFHPAWHELMAAGVRDGLHALPWTETARPARTSARAALYSAASRPRPASAAR